MAPIFSQPQGPVVPISLFGQAATAGTNVGNAIPTTTTAIIQGATEGFQKGLNIIEQTQQIAQRQNQIEMQPIENQIRQEYAKSLELRNQVDTLKAQNAVELNSLQLEETKATLQDNIEQLQQRKLVRDQSAAFSAQYSQADGNTKAQLLFGGQFDNLFAANPKLYEQSLRNLYMDPNSGLDLKVKEQLGTILTKNNIRNDYEKQRVQNYPNYVKASEKLFNGAGSVMQENVGQPNAELFWSNAQVVPRGTYRVAPNSNRVLVDPITGQLQRTSETVSADKTLGVDVIYRDPATGDYLIAGQGDSTLQDNFSTWKAQRYIQDGSALTSRLNQVDREAAERSNNQSTQQQQNIDNIPDPSSILREQSRQALGVSPSVFAKITPILDKVQNDIGVTLEARPEQRGADAAMTSSAVQTALARKIAYAQYDESPALQVAYTQSDVDAWNRDIQKQIDDITSVIPPTTNSKLREEYEAKLRPFIVDNPRDLYYQQHRDALESNVRNLMNMYVARANKSRASKPATAKATMEWLSTNRNSRGAAE